MAHTQYVDKADLKTYLGLSGSGQDTKIDNAINSASRLIDKLCNRYFYQDETLQTKYKKVTNRVVGVSTYNN
ncbi:MAG: phage head-tail connector protein, partial [Burkholderiaceae bacterium]